MIRFRSGISLLSKVLKTFDSALADLDVAVEQMEAQSTAEVEKRITLREKLYQKTAKLEAKIDAVHEKAVAQVEASYQRDDELLAAIRRAEKVRQNIAALIGIA